MPKKRRDYLKTKLANVMANLMDNTIAIKQMAGDFEPVHPELAQQLLLIAEGHQVTFSLSYDFWRKTWGDGAENWTKWTSVRRAYVDPPVEE